MTIPALSSQVSAAAGRRSSERTKAGPDRVASRRTLRGDGIDRTKPGRRSAALVDGRLTGTAPRQPSASIPPTPGIRVVHTSCMRCAWRRSPKSLMSQADRTFRPEASRPSRPPAPRHPENRACCDGEGAIIPSAEATKATRSRTRARSPRRARRESGGDRRYARETRRSLSPAAGGAGSKRDRRCDSLAGTMTLALERG